MAVDRPRFARQRAVQPPKGRVMVVGLVLCAGLLWVRSTWQKPAPSESVVVVEVRGDVPHPGFHAIPPPGTLKAAITASGGDAGAFVDQDLGPGKRVEVHENAVKIVSMDERLVFGLPIDLNTASVAALQTIPGVGPSRATAIVEDRDNNGRFSSIDDLVRVRGIGPLTIVEIKEFVSVQ